MVSRIAVDSAAAKSDIYPVLNLLVKGGQQSKVLLLLLTLIAFFRGFFKMIVFNVRLRLVR